MISSCFENPSAPSDQAEPTLTTPPPSATLSASSSQSWIKKLGKKEGVVTKTWVKKGVDVPGKVGDRRGDAAKGLAMEDLSTPPQARVNDHSVPTPTRSSWYPSATGHEGLEMPKEAYAV